ncbi:hypothetical protein NIZ92_11600 [Alcaligenes sp. 1735tsa3]|uniref:hypothetical protein n=1 Tax=Alcaligenes sp. 1735tsa3 TaxID=2953809 RepID=UPI0020A71471|nr:hypothetical protein [Alcaligenes sp. 1735tsa3]USY23967.1 hypothetical protein NIZ92_11600 [Alcaligenes sp. 1735tsa3]
MEKLGTGSENAGMDKTELPRFEIIDRATELAYQAFNCPTDEHITGIYDRLVWNERHGLGELGAVTVH